MLVALVTGGAGAWAWTARPRLPAAERGRRLAEDVGCFTCHGPGGIRGTPNPGRTDGSVPNFEGDAMMFASDSLAVREWIADGVPAKRAVSKTWQAERDAGAITMPAFRDLLTDAQIDDLVAYVRVMSGDPAPPDGPAARGRERAKELGCFGCHGAGGRLAPLNAGSFKGYVPSWDGSDFAELVHDRAEFAAWVEDGIAPRFAENPAARFFLERGAIHMPAYERHLQPGDLDALWAYVTWVREGR